MPHSHMARHVLTSPSDELYENQREEDELLDTY
jgi:hypothetical protein